METKGYYLQWKPDSMKYSVSIVFVNKKTDTVVYSQAVYDGSFLKQYELIGTLEKSVDVLTAGKMLMEYKKAQIH